MKAKIGDTVSVHYTGTLEDGTVFDSSEGREPLEFAIGSGQLIKGFDDAVTGMAVGDEKSITLEPENAYGNIRPDLVAKLPKDKFPEGVQAGMTLLFKDPNGNQIPLKVAAVGQNDVTVDLNHPLAGKQLTFKIRLVHIK
jgi:peptidylprolyl isomerase